jgi:hypothetical protein
MEAGHAGKKVGIFAAFFILGIAGRKDGLQRAETQKQKQNSHKTRSHGISFGI